MGFRIQVDVLDCLGCENCVDICPGKKGENALEMVPIHTQMDNQVNWDYMVKNVSSKAHLVDVQQNVKNSQFATPLFEFSVLAPGENTYIKLITRGDRMMIANATAVRPSTGHLFATRIPKRGGKGHGYSLFEDNAEFGYGFATPSEHEETD